MSYRFKLLTLLLSILLYLQKAKAQTCNGAFGDPVINIDFGRGTNTFGAQLTNLVTNYGYVSGTPEDGYYTIAKNTVGMNGGWHQITNHTPNDPDGYMMVVNASNEPSIFYQTTINGLCPGTTYEFAAWIANILNYAGNKPNITFSIETTNGQILQTYTTGDILESTTATWKRYSTTFTTQDSETIVLKMTNNGPGGIGNDIVLDDITFRACGPQITSTFDTGNSTSNLCAGESANFSLSATVSAGFNDPVYQWQSLINGTWTALNGQNNTSITISFNNAIAGNYQYRLTVSEPANVESLFCKVSSNPLVINVNDKPIPIARNSGPVCEGTSVQLFASDGLSFTWSGPNGFSSNIQNPILNNTVANQTGTYTVTVTNAAGCSSTSETEVQILPLINSSTNITAATICEGDNMKLEAYGGTKYTWLPIDGLSNPNIYNPIASPKENTTYTVTISNGACSSTESITINVLKRAKVNAGDDKKILTGQSVMLNGTVSGDNVSYFWTPADYLDDPTKLNPIATPPYDITYTLNVNSSCDVITDKVFVLVYPKIEISNTFTPNGDGINDTWNIPAIAAFANPKLKVINRYGQLVFESNNATAWDGKFKGKDLPSATYYYTLYLNEDFKIYSGWVLLTR